MNSLMFVMISLNSSSNRADVDKVESLPELLAVELEAERMAAFAFIGFVAWL